MKEINVFPTLFLPLLILGLVVFLVPPVAADLVLPSNTISVDQSAVQQSVYTSPVHGHLVWNYTTGSWISSSPAVSGGVVYVGSEDGNVYALNAGSGTPVWTYQTGGYVTSSPKLSGSRIYVGSGDRVLYALDADSGTPAWTYRAGAGISSSPVVENGIVYIGSEDGIMYALDANSGALLWNYTTGAYIHSSPAVAEGTVYFGSYDHNLYALNATTGRLIWNYTTGNNILSSPAVTEGTVYFGSYDHNLYALNAATGRLIWNYTTGNNIASSPSVNGGTVYIGSGDGNIYALNASSGALIWSYQTGGEVDSTPLIDNGIVYAGSADGNIYSLSATDGHPLWDYHLGNSGYSSPAIANQIIYVGSYDHNLYALSNLPPVADFNSDVTQGTTPLVVKFTDTSTGSPSSWLWDFGDGETSTLQNPVHTYLVSGNLTVNLTVTNGGGSDCRINVGYLRTVTILPLPPVADFTVDSNSGIAPFTVQFTDTSTGSPTAWFWDFGDGNTSTRENPSYTYLTPGNFTVTLTATKRGGSSRMTTPVTVLARVIRPGPDFSVNVSFGTAPLAVQFTDLSTGPGITGWAWDFNNDGIVDSTDQNPVCVYNLPGSYSVNLTVTNAFGTRSIVKPDVITVCSPIPIVTFTANKTSGTPPLAVQFTDTSAGQNITGWAWDFTNSGTVESTDQNPVTVYTEPGNYTVNLTVTNPYGSNTTSLTDFIMVDSLAPVVTFTANTTSGAAPLAVQFTDTSAGQNITGWAWDFDNSGTIRSTDPNPVMVYKQPGNYTVNLTVTNLYGSNTTSRIGFVQVTNGVIPSFTANQTSGFAPLAVQFRDISSGPGITGWAWDFTNNGTAESSDQNPVIVYTTPGNYTVNLTVTNALGSNTTMKGGFIKVRSLAAVAGFTANSTTGIPPLAVQFTDTSAGQNITGWAWDFDNSGTVKSTDPNPVMVYKQPGNYTVNLTVTNAYGSSTTSGFVTVSNGAPTARFAVNKTSGPAPLAVQFRDISTGPNITGWAWDFDNGGTVESIDKNPSLVYNEPGNYTITYTVTNAYGSDTIVRKNFITVTD